MVASAKLQSGKLHQYKKLLKLNKNIYNEITYILLFSISFQLFYLKIKVATNS